MYRPSLLGPKCEHLVITLPMKSSTDYLELSLMLDPIDFAAMYHQRMQEAGEDGENGEDQA